MFRYVFKDVRHNSAMDTVTINKQALADLVRLKEELDTIVESMELISDKEFMDSYKKAKEQVRKRDFADWNAV